MLFDKHYIDAELHGNALRFINHVCVGPNCRYETVWVDGLPRISVEAIRPIRVGEELTTSYDFDRVIGSMCHCGHEFCQGFMGPAVEYEPGSDHRRIKGQATPPPRSGCRRHRRWGGNGAGNGECVCFVRLWERRAQSFTLWFKTMPGS